MEGLVTLVFFKIKTTNLASWGYFDGNVSKSYIFANLKLLWRQYYVHNRYFSKPCNFEIFEGRSLEFGKLGYFDMFIKVSA